MTKSVECQSSVLYANYFTHLLPHSVNYRDGLSFYLFRLQAEGTCRALVDGKYETIIPGDLLVYPPDQRYGLIVEPRCDPASGDTLPVGDYFLAGSGEWMDSWWKNKGMPTKTSIGFDDTLLTLWKHIISEKKKVMGNHEEIMDYLLRAFCLTLEQTIQTKQRAKGADIAYKLKQFIENHAHEPISLEAISASVSLSVSRCSHLFKAAFGKSLFAYCIDVRLKLAQQQVLYSSIALEQAAEKSGFQSYPHFCRLFRERFGHSPTEYRRKFGFEFNPY
ncbi:AraC family transcriptional regulator [Paenibacillus sp. HB172176]|uniref:AraC family transcriptional regulator n=1 Tax=Paenibacillus sp. HB172176 TaxID=2493690 RepID=UPI00143B6D1E|nr:AraC family transcriptional regulator [Paenibacillus sp. HB172176]